MIEVGIKPLKLAEECRVPAVGTDVFCWPEFQALAQRLGLPLDRPISELVLHLSVDEVAKCYFEMRGSDALESEFQNDYRRSIPDIGEPYPDVVKNASA